MTIPMSAFFEVIRGRHPGLGAVDDDALIALMDEDAISLDLTDLEQLARRGAELEPDVDPGPSGAAAVPPARVAGLSAERYPEAAPTSTDHELSPAATFAAECAPWMPLLERRRSQQREAGMAYLRQLRHLMGDVEVVHFSAHGSDADYVVSEGLRRSFHCRQDDEAATWARIVVNVLTARIAPLADCQFMFQFCLQSNPQELALLQRLAASASHDTEQIRRSVPMTEVTTNELLAALERRGTVTRQADDGDRVELTAFGKLLSRLLSETP